MDSEDDNYEPTDSEAEYDEEERELMDQLHEERKERAKRHEKGNEVLQFSDSDDDEDEDDVAGLIADSDIEGGAGDDDDDLPDTTNWGTKKSTFYNTDFVDPDYSSYTAQEEEMALAEEEEAKKIQLRLLKQMNEEDFLPDYPEELLPQSLQVGDEDDADEHDNATIKVDNDLSGLAAPDRLLLVQRESPEFVGLTQDVEKNLQELQELTVPVLNYVRNHNVPMVPALQFANLYQNILLTYISNVSFYLLLKSQRKPVKTHPVVRRLLQLKQLRNQLAERYETFIRPQLEALLERIRDGDAFTVLGVAERKAKLQILNQYEKQQNKTAESAMNGETDNDSDSDEDGSAKEAAADEEAEAGADEREEEDSRRGITYQIAKNKGLTPHRKKELRNPRVKHRGKYRKALIRRKGAVRQVRTEVKRYGGEISGIKATVTKSIKFK